MGQDNKNVNTQEPATHHPCKDASVDAFLNDNDGQSWLVRFAEQRKAFTELFHLVAGDHWQLSITNAVPIHDDAIRQAVVHLCTITSCQPVNLWGRAAVLAHPT